MTVWTSYQGIEVIESDPNVKVRHPRWGYDPKTLATLKESVLLLLADGILLVVCDEPGCGFNGITGFEPYVKPEGEQKSILKQADSVLSHRNATHDRKAGRKPMYSDDVIKVVIKTYIKWKSTRIRGWSDSAAKELEDLGFRPAHSGHWTGSVVVSLANRYMKEERFKNIKAAAMDDDDKETLARMVREAAAANGGKNSLGSTARITEKHKHTPVDFAAIIAAKGDVSTAPDQDKEEAVVAAPRTPTLTFAANSAEPAPVKTLVVDPKVVAKETWSDYPPHLRDVVLPPSDYTHVVDLPDGTPMFMYKGVLMAGKPVKGVSVET
jgi:hypothetical protein